MKVGLIQLRKYMAEALKEQFDGNDINVTVFHTEKLCVQSVKLKSLHPFNLIKAILSAPRCDVYIIGAFVWPAFTAALMSLIPWFRFGIEIGGWVGDAIGPQGYQGEGKPLLRIYRALYPVAFNIIHARADFIICNSRSLATMTVAEYPTTRGKTHTIHEGIILSPVHPGGGAAETSQLKLLTVSSADAATKLPGIYTVLDAFEMVAANHIGASLSCAISASPGKSEDRLNAVMKHVEKSPFSDRISINVNHKNMHELYTNSYLMVYSTPTDTSDGLPRALVEAQALGLPVVAGDTDGCPEAVNNGITGLIVKNTPKHISDGIEQLISDRNLRNSMATDAPIWFTKQFSWEKIAIDYKNFLHTRFV